MASTGAKERDANLEKEVTEHIEKSFDNMHRHMKDIKSSIDSMKRKVHNITETAKDILAMSKKMEGEQACATDTVRDYPPELSPFPDADLANSTAREEMKKFGEEKVKREVSQELLTFEATSNEDKDSPAKGEFSKAIAIPPTNAHQSYLPLIVVGVARRWNEHIGSTVNKRDRWRHRLDEDDNRNGERRNWVTDRVREIKWARSPKLNGEGRWAAFPENYVGVRPIIHELADQEKIKFLLGNAQDPTQPLIFGSNQGLNKQQNGATKFQVSLCSVSKEKDIEIGRIIVADFVGACACEIHSREDSNLQSQVTREATLEDAQTFLTKPLTRTGEHGSDFGISISISRVRQVFEWAKAILGQRDQTPPIIHLQRTSSKTELFEILLSTNYGGFENLMVVLLGLLLKPFVQWKSLVSILRECTEAFLLTQILFPKLLKVISYRLKNALERDKTATALLGDSRLSGKLMKLLESNLGLVL